MRVIGLMGVVPMRPTHAPGKQSSERSVETIRYSVRHVLYEFLNHIHRSLTLSVTQVALEQSTALLSRRRSGAHPSDYAHALSAFYFLPAVFLPAQCRYSFFLSNWKV